MSQRPREKQRNGQLSDAKACCERQQANSLWFPIFTLLLLILKGKIVLTFLLFTMPCLHFAPADQAAGPASQPRILTT